MHRRIVAIGVAAAWLLSGTPVRADDSVVACVQAAENAQSQRSSHQLRAAHSKFLLCAQESCPVVVRNDCAGWLAEVDKLMPSIVVQARDTKGVELTDVRVMMDGEVLADRLDGLAIPVDPGVHLFQFERPGVPALQQQILIREGEKGRAMPITLATPPPPYVPPPPPYRPRPVTYIFSGLAVGGLAGWAYFGLKGKADADDIGALPCAATQTCDPGRVANARRELAAADVSAAVSLVSLGVAAYFYFSGRPSSARSATAMRTTFALAPGNARVSVSASF